MTHQTPQAPRNCVVIASPSPDEAPWVYGGGVFTEERANALAQSLNDQEAKANHEYPVQYDVHLLIPGDAKVFFFTDHNPSTGVRIPWSALTAETQIAIARDTNAAIERANKETYL